jgi:hypothetical protein
MAALPELVAERHALAVGDVLQLLFLAVDEAQVLHGGLLL